MKVPGIICILLGMIALSTIWIAHTHHRPELQFVIEGTTEGENRWTAQQLAQDQTRPKRQEAASGHNESLADSSTNQSTSSTKLRGQPLPSDLKDSPMPKVLQHSLDDLPAPLQRPAIIVKQKKRDGEYYSHAATTSVPEPRQVFKALDKFWKATISNNFTQDLSMLIAKQERPDIQQLGISCCNCFDDTDSIEDRIAFFNSIAAWKNLDNFISVVTTWSGEPRMLREQLLPWMQHHLEMGVARFYVLYDGIDTQTASLLKSIKPVTPFFIHPPVASPEDVAHMEATKMNDSRDWVHKAGNSQLMWKQEYGVNLAVAKAREQGFKWLVHIDMDELLHPGNGEGTLSNELASLPDSVSSVRFMNFEAQPEGVGVVNRFEQVSLFRVHRHFVDDLGARFRSRFTFASNVAYLSLYANGKSAVRVDAPGVQMLGPHFFGGPKSSRWVTPKNPEGRWTTHVSRNTVILHYAYCTLQDVRAKGYRSCPGAMDPITKQLNQTQVEECFVIDFDRQAFLAVMSNKTQAVENFFFSHMVLSEGSQLSCERNGTKGFCPIQNAMLLQDLLLQAHLLERILAPRQISCMHERLYRLWSTHRKPPL